MMANPQGVVFNKFPKTVVKQYQNGVIKGNKEIAEYIKNHHKNAEIIVVECYPGVNYDVLRKTFFTHFEHTAVCVDDYALSETLLDTKLQDHLTDDRVFGRMSQYEIEEFYPSSAEETINHMIQDLGKVIVFGFGASRMVKGDLTLYLDLTRWEIKTRYRNGLANWQSSKTDLDTLKKEKRGFFVEWRTADRIKNTVFSDIDYYFDANDETILKMVSQEDLFAAINETTEKPFSMVPYFDPGVWGGQWMKEVCDLDRSKENFAWSFNGVMEENAMHYQYGEDYLASPAINLVLFKPKKLLGDKVYARFGTEFPIRFDFLDTVEGGNLSLQVHPLTEYIYSKFGMAYTQDESYYILDSNQGGIYLGLKENINRAKMIQSLKDAEAGKAPFNADEFINYYDVKKHDHISIPAGTVHCSATGTMVLEISATPYIFTFKMWDWGRVGLDGLPRPIHLNHAVRNIQWDRTTKWIETELLNQIKVLSNEAGVLEEKTGLHPRQFIETRRHTHDNKALHSTHDSVNVLMLIEGETAIVESPENHFEPFVVNFAETFIIPEHVKTYTVRPYGASEGRTIKTIKAFVRT